MSKLLQIIVVSTIALLSLTLCAQNVDRDYGTFGGEWGWTWASIEQKRPGEFVDTYEFKIAKPTYSFEAVRTMNIPGSLEIQNIKTSVWNIGPGHSVHKPVYIMPGSFEEVQYYQPGHYLMEITGSAGSHGGAYTLAIITNAPLAAPVPEPSTWIMLLAGLSVMGIIARRRS